MSRLVTMKLSCHFREQFVNWAYDEQTRRNYWVTMRAVTWKFWNSRHCLARTLPASPRTPINMADGRTNTHTQTKNKIWRKPFLMWRMELLHPAMWHVALWLWNRNSEFTKWQHPALWYVALGWHAIEFAQTSAILEFYISISTISPQSICHSVPVSEFIQIGPPSAEKNDVMSILKMADLSHLGF